MCQAKLTHTISLESLNHSRSTGYDLQSCAPVAKGNIQTAEQWVEKWPSVETGLHMVYIYDKVG